VRVWDLSQYRGSGDPDLARQLHLRAGDPLPGNRAKQKRTARAALPDLRDYSVPGRGPTLGRWIRRRCTADRRAFPEAEGRASGRFPRPG